MVKVPVSLLLDRGLTPAAKVIWMARSLQPDAGPVKLAVLSGLARSTVEANLSHLGSNGLPPASPRSMAQGAPGTSRNTAVRVKVPGNLLAERKVGAQAKVLYGLLQATPGFRWMGGQFTYSALPATTSLSMSTLRRAIAQLIGAGWMQVTQTHRLSPFQFTLGSPEQRRSQAEAAAADRRLKRSKFAGEAIMQEYLSLLIDSDQFTDNARPGFLVSPLTGERLELDRFYPPDLAFEYHGAQHDRVTERFTQDEVDAQHLRDLIKAGICVYRDIRLVVIRAEDLSLQGMRKKVGQGVPQRDLAGHEQLVELLEEASLTYQAAAGVGRRQE